MANNKKYISLNRLSNFLDNLRNTFALLSHKHTVADLTDYTVDSALSSTSTNPIQNKVIDAEFEAVSQAMNALDLAIDGKADASHDHNDVYYTETEIDAKLSDKSDKTHNHDSDYADINHNHDDVYSLTDHHHDSKYDAKGTASSTVSTHNTSTSAHNDIRDLITGLTNRLNALANSDDTTLDQLSEIVEYIKNNKSLIDGVTTSKVNVSDIIDNLTTNVVNKPLSAAQGVAIKTLIDEIKDAKADWNQNDSTSIDYIKNRPFWTGNPTETPLVNSVTFNTTAGNGYAYARNPFFIELIEDVEYDVTWNGTTYTSTCKLLSGVLAIGNASILGMGSNTQEPFLINYQNGANYVYASNAQSVTISIVAHIPEVHKIDNKYIDFPEGSYIGVTNENFGEVFNDYENNTASGGFSHAEGSSTTASGNFSHAEGANTIASGHWSHAEGYHTDATARWSHAEGYATTAASDAQHVQGKFNVVDTENKYAHIVGNGSGSSDLANIHTLDWDGNGWFKGNIYVGGDSMDDTLASRVTTEADHEWTLIYDSGEIPDIANSISGIDVSGYTNFEVLVNCYNDGDSYGSRTGSVIFTAQNGKTYQFPVWTNMFSKGISTVAAMAQFKLVDGWLVCPYASKLVDYVDIFNIAEGGTAGNLTHTGSGMMRCTSPLSTLTISNLDQNSKYYFGSGSRVMVWGWKA